MTHLKKKAFSFLLFFLFLSFLTFPVLSHGREKIKLSEEVLEKETVFPIFYSRNVLKNRLIKLKRRFEIGIGTGWDTTEAIYRRLNFNTNLTYYINEFHGVNVFFSKTQKGFSAVGDGLYTGTAFTRDLEEAKQVAKPQMSKVPYRTHMFWFSHQFIPYYGKVSLTKNITTHLIFFSLLGIGAIGFNDQSHALSVKVGIGQKFHLTKKIALRFSTNLIGYFSPDITSIPEGYNSVEEVESESLIVIPRKKYKEALSINSIINLNLTVLI